MTLSSWNAITGIQTPGNVAMRQGNFVLRAPARLLRVLVVDDDCDTADSLTMLVRLWGHDVRSAYGGVVALQLASDIRPDVVLLDVAMPIVNGCEVAQQLRRQSRFDQSRLIAVSGYVDEAHRLLCRQAGFDDFLIKPLELANLEGLLMSECVRLSSLLDLASDESPNIGVFDRYKTADVCSPTATGWPDDGRAVRLQQLVGPSAG